MSGHLTGVASQIQKDVLSALFVHCFAHCTNLCLQAVGCVCVPVWNALDLVMELSQLITYSPKRSTLFAYLEQQLWPDATSLKLLCPTRWTIRTAAISAVLSGIVRGLGADNCWNQWWLWPKAGGFLHGWRSLVLWIFLEVNSYLWHYKVRIPPINKLLLLQS